MLREQENDIFNNVHITIEVIFHFILYRYMHKGNPSLKTNASKHYIRELIIKDALKNIKRRLRQQLDNGSSDVVDVSEIYDDDRNVPATSIGTTSKQGFEKNELLSSNKRTEGTEMKIDGGSDYNLGDYGNENGANTYNKLMSINSNIGAIHGSKHQLKKNSNIAKKKALHIQDIKHKKLEITKTAHSKSHSNQHSFSADYSTHNREVSSNKTDNATLPKVSNTSGIDHRNNFTKSVKSTNESKSEKQSLFMLNEANLDGEINHVLTDANNTLHDIIHKHIANNSTDTMGSKINITASDAKGNEVSSEPLKVKSYETQGLNTMNKSSPVTSKNKEFSEEITLYGQNNSTNRNLNASSKQIQINNDQPILQEHKERTSSKLPKSIHVMTREDTLKETASKVVARQDDNNQTSNINKDNTDKNNTFIQNNAGNPIISSEMFEVVTSEVATKYSTTDRAHQPRTLKHKEAVHPLQNNEKLSLILNDKRIVNKIREENEEKQHTKSKERLHPIKQYPFDKVPKTSVDDEMQKYNQRKRKVKSEYDTKKSSWDEAKSHKKSKNLESVLKKLRNSKKSGNERKNKLSKI